MIEMCGAKRPADPIARCDLPARHPGDHRDADLHTVWCTTTPAQHGLVVGHRGIEQDGALVVPFRPADRIITTGQPTVQPSPHGFTDITVTYRVEGDVLVRGNTVGVPEVRG